MYKEVSFLRHNGWVGPEDLQERLVIVGCGATGSNLALAAAKMGFHIFDLWDADIVEDHNLPNQAYALKDIGSKKVDALERVLKEFNPKIEVTKHSEFLTTEHKDQIEGIMIIATDTMSSRYDFHEIFSWNPNIQAVFETRLGFDYGEINYIDPLDSRSCQNFYDGLKPDSEIPEGPCNQRICTTLVGIVSNTTVHIICAQAAARRQGEIYTPKTKTMFSLEPEPKTYFF